MVSLEVQDVAGEVRCSGGRAINTVTGRSRYPWLLMNRVDSYFDTDSVKQFILLDEEKHIYGFITK